jgi:hypothetical protein
MHKAMRGDSKKKRILYIKCKKKALRNKGLKEFVCGETNANLERRGVLPY